MKQRPPKKEPDDIKEEPCVDCGKPVARSIHSRFSAAIMDSALMCDTCRDAWKTRPENKTKLYRRKGED